VGSGTPAPRVAVLEREALAAVGDAAVAARITGSGSLPRALGAAAFGGFVAEEVARLGALVRVAGIRAD
jgi:tripartite-type tricarboxylate transporter receptor subunit TctC